MCVGAAKFYRRECFEEIGGFVRQVMWDGIDCHRCRYLGWLAGSEDDPEIRFIHLRPMGSSERGIVAGRIRHGFGQYFMGSSPIYMLVSACYRMLRPPYLIGGMAMAYGYFRSMIRHEPRYEDPALRSFIRRYQMNILRSGRKRALEQTDRDQEAAWLAGHGSS